MLGKLIKYDLLADYKKYAALYISMIATSVLLLFFDKMTSWISNNNFVKIMAALFGVLFSVLVIVAGVMLLVFSTIRFYKNIVRDEGYLMHTLPVPTWQLIASKFISVYIWFFATAAVIFICSGIAAGDPFWIFKILEGSFSDEFKAGFQLGYNAANGLTSDMVFEEDWQLLSEMFRLYFVLMLLSPFMTMSSIYFSFALGNLFNKSKLAMSVIMYFLMQFAEMILGSFCSVFTMPDFLAEASKYQDEMPMSVVMDFFSRIMTVSTVVSVILSVGFAIAAERIFAKKLNLE